MSKQEAGKKKAENAIPDMETLEKLISDKEDNYDKGKEIVLLAHYSQAIIFSVILGAINISQGLRTTGTLQIGFGLGVVAILAVYF